MTRTAFLAVALSVVATVAASADIPAVRAEALARIKRHLAPLTHPLGDRLPLLTWQNQHFPSGIDSGRVEQNQSVFIERGFLPLCNGCNTVEGAAAYLPVFRYWQTRGMPVCILPQSWLQVPFVYVRRTGQFRCAHAPPASGEHAYPCPARMLENKWIGNHAAQIRATLARLEEDGIDVRLLCVDFEAGAYLRNVGDREANVKAQIAEALKCPSCLQRFGRDALATPAAYARTVDRVRAQTIRRMLSEPVRDVFPDALVGNFYAWPIDRLPRPAGRWPAYGYTGSGMNVLMPRLYMAPGWGGAGSDQQLMNWNALTCCLDAFSPAAAVRQDDERLIPWVHVWLGGRYLDFIMKRKRALPEPWAMSEVACHMMLRGAETFAFWMDAQIGDLPADYPHPEYAAMGQFVYDVKGIQEGFNEMLAFNAFLREAEPMTFDVPGERGVLGEATATWSGMQTSEKALVRTIVFDGGRTHEKELTAYGRRITLPFGPRGVNYWVHPDGRVEAAHRP